VTGCLYPALNCSIDLAKWAALAGDFRRWMVSIKLLDLLLNYFYLKSIDYKKTIKNQGVGNSV